MKAKCKICGKILYENDKVWEVTTVSYDGWVHYEPACSEQCADIVKKDNILLHKYRLSKVEKEPIKTMLLKEMFSEAEQKATSHE